ncbi:MAG TPA: DUF2283 domain-containing protein [Gemmatimonadales bacterium]|nr:DUF2283 domain-containing protein [Gemmatimonadales bacterium]
MKLHYYPETDSVYIERADEKAVDSREVASGIVSDIGAGGRVVGVDDDHARDRVDLSKLEADGIPYPAEPIGH